MKNKYKISLSILCFIALCNIYAVKQQYLQSPITETEDFFINGIKKNIDELTKLKLAVKQGNGKEIAETFLSARMAYKRTEFLSEFYYPYLTRQINGPAQPFSDGENFLKAFEPEGYQVIEEKIFPKYNKANEQKLISSIDLLQEKFETIVNQKYPLGFQEKYIFEAMRYEIYRLIAQGISGFDSPIAFNSIPEASSSLEGLKTCISFFNKGENEFNSKAILLNNIQSAQNYLSRPSNFNKFDRLSFLYHFANPISGQLLAFQKELGIYIPQNARRINTDAKSMFDMKNYDPSIFSPNDASNATPQRVALGKKLFFDPILSGNNKQTCASCHKPEMAFTDHLTKSIALDGKSSTARNAPTLLNAAFQPKQFYDSRAIFLEDQVFEVVHNSNEMGGSLAKAVILLKKDTIYNKLFKNAYSDNKPISIANVTNAVASYIRSLVSMNSRFDQYMAGNLSALNTIEKQGFNLFMGKAKCGTCHYVPFFNGVAPPYFAESESEVIGVPDNADKKIAKLDPDLGKYNLYKIEILKHSFKTPTLRNIELTAPYMHNGVFKTLEQVIDFYNDGGGAGWKIGPENQTLGTDKLGLSKSEKTKLICFLKSLTDTASVH